MPGNQLSLETDAKKNVNGDVHLEFARDILNRLWTAGCNRKFSFPYHNPLTKLTIITIEQEKKMLAPMLAKLHVSPASTTTLIREVYSDISEAVEDKKLGLDATGRNSLYKIHVSLGKIVNALDKEAEKEKEAPGRTVRMSSVTPSVTPTAADEEEEEDDATAVARTSEVDEEDEDDTIVAPAAAKRRGTTDSLVEELLSDDDVDMSGT